MSMMTRKLKMDQDKYNKTYDRMLRLVQVEEKEYGINETLRHCKEYEESLQRNIRLFENDYSNITIYEDHVRKLKALKEAMSDCGFE